MSTDETQVEARTERLREELAEARAEADAYRVAYNEGREEWKRAEADNAALLEAMRRVADGDGDGQCWACGAKAPYDHRPPCRLGVVLAQPHPGAALLEERDNLRRLHEANVAAGERVATEFNRAGVGNGRDGVLTRALSSLEELTRLRRAEADNADIRWRAENLLGAGMEGVSGERLRAIVAAVLGPSITLGDAYERGAVVRPEPLNPDACATCGKPAACIGRYENAETDEPACNACCGHGNEDGHCVPVAEYVPGRTNPEPDSLCQPSTVEGPHKPGTNSEPGSAALFATVRSTVAAASGKGRAWDALATLERERGEMAGRLHALRTAAEAVLASGAWTPTFKGLQDALAGAAPEASTRLERLEQVVAAFRELEWARGDWLGMCPFRSHKDVVCTGTDGHQSGMGTPKPQPHREGCPFGLLHILMPESGEVPEVVPVARVRQVVQTVMAEAQASVREHRGKGEPGSTRHDLAMVAAGGYAAGEEVLRRLALPVEATACVPVARVKEVLVRASGVLHRQGYGSGIIRDVAADLGIPLE